ncbi:MAG: caspase domain-containing protein [Paracoccaceae bacterium]
MVRSAFLFLASLLFLAGSARAEPRIALVIGNSKYQYVVSLDNPVSDANLVSKSLEQVGFEVTLLTDSDQRGMKRGIADFGRKLRKAGPDATALFYYAGHGVQSQGNNYLLPVDSEIQDEADLDLVGVEADWVLRQLFSARNRTSIIILDACRNNPFATQIGFNDRGLAEMKAPTGSFIAYATAPGDVALDGTGANSPFSESLAEGILAEGRPIEQMFKQVRISVRQQTGGAQTPWDSSSLTGDFFFRPAAPMSNEELAELQLWNSVKESRDPVQLMLFLRSYPAGKFETEARQLLGQVMEAELNAPLRRNPAQPPVADKPAAGTQPSAVPATREPDARETALIEKAQGSGSIADYEAYVREFPAGVFVDLARMEIDNLRRNAAKADDTAPAAKPAEEVTASVDTKPETTPDAAIEDGSITFVSPLVTGPPEIVGRSIEQLFQSTALFPPVEGIPESLWKGQKCSNCHKWNKERLCEQAKTYLNVAGQRSLTKDHPFGGTFKRNLRAWAGGGCR